MPTRVDVWSDFVCPYCFAVSFSLKALRASHAVDIHWRSYELHPAGAPPIPPAYLAKIEAARPRFAQMMRETYAVEIEQGPYGIDSRPALIGEQYAQRQSPEIGAAYHEAVTRAYWLEGRSIDDRALLGEIAVELQMDGAAFAAALANPDYEALVNADIRQAADYGLNGVPALVFAERYLVSGARPYEVLAQVVDQIEQQTVR